MADIYGVTPTFATGQVLSATAHLNPLQEYIQALRDDLTGSAMPFLAWYPYGDVIVSKTWKGALRHKKNYVSYSYVILEGWGDCQITIGGYLVPGSLHNGPGAYSAVNVDISSLLLIADEFYDVEFTIANEGSVEGKAYVWFICEAYTPSTYSLASFTDGTTPTATQWNALSAYAAELATAASVPQPLVFIPKGRYRHLVGTVNHHARYLAYSFNMNTPYHEDGGSQYSEVTLKVNGTLALRRRIGTPSSASTGEDYAESPSGEYTWTGLLDLDTYPGGLVVGTDYTLELTTANAGTSEGSQDNNQWFYLYEIPEENPTLTGWTAFVPWAHGNYVYGNTVAPQVVAIKDNLDLLAATVNYHNFPAPNDAGAGLYAFRRWRYLHYRTWRRHTEDEVSHDASIESTNDAVLIYTYKGKEERVTLDEAYTDWRFVDLDSVEGLYAGVQYRLEYVRSALEDVEA